MNLSQELAKLQQENEAKMSPDMANMLAEAYAELRVRIGGMRRVSTGDIVPDFTLPHMMGYDVTLSALLAKGPVVLSFFRGGWCPFCNLEISALKEALSDIETRNSTLVLMSPETVDSSLTTCKLNGLEYEILCETGLEVLNDHSNQVARELGLVYELTDDLRHHFTKMGVDLSRHNGDDSWELPIPATLIVDRDRRVRLAFTDIDFTKRLEPSVILEALDELIRN